MTEEQQEPHVNIGDIIQINKGTEKGEQAKVIAVYTNSVAVELNRKEKNGNLARTVINHSKYEVKS
ncbi:MAG: YkvS family protein [Bacillaceae bacterium]|uniref:YkvS family protein n=1 Tax=Alkalihalobacterium chitinilyticum TaxID=2980103 RepID=A0ABT5VJI0_9BACI|nr:DUF2187 family protein [Alkalihalobacterium chitinilyticum]MDE5415613.1 YkvS family protein [Alkalihalobacterium chitinilyticum]MEB1809221.1 YkvS family protein [Bacillaceae bacterium]